MINDLSHYRTSYEKGALHLNEVPESPITLFKTWFDEVDKQNPNETNAMTLSTLGVDGFPKSRVVLLKAYNREGFIFYTNYNSHKGIAIEANPNVCLSFFWHTFERQVIIKGIAKRTSEEVSDSYFKTRPRGSQLGALASDQSAIIPDRLYLEKKLNDLDKQYANTNIERPRYWGGYLVAPVEMEFWQGRPNRLHDRICYKKRNENQWIINRLSP